MLLREIFVLLKQACIVEKIFALLKCTILFLFLSAESARIQSVIFAALAQIVFNSCEKNINKTLRLIRLHERDSL